MLIFTCKALQNHAISNSQPSTTTTNLFKSFLTISKYHKYKLTLQKNVRSVLATEKLQMGLCGHRFEQPPNHMYKNTLVQYVLCTGKS